ncbi:MAG: hypothetical protein WB784_00400 [Rhodanobacteraceae bacterium]
MVGGTASVISGGKFANGAVTGAFQYAFGRVAQREFGATSADEGGDPLPTDLSAAPNDEVRREMTSSNPDDRIAAAKAAIDRFKIHPLAGRYDLYYRSEQGASGLTTYQGGVFSTVTLGPSAYVTWSQLGATLGHEIEVHVYENAMFGGYVTNKQYNQREVRAYQYNLDNVARFGNTLIERAVMEERLRHYGGGQ